MTVTRTRASEATYREVRDWLLDEAEMLDDGRFREWLDLTTEDVTYVIPVRVSRERTAGNGVITNMAHMDENQDSLEMRVLRIETEHCWAEDPPSRTRHFVTNIRVHDEGEDLHVKSNVMMYRTRGDLAAYDMLVGERQDILRRTDAGLRLVRRVVLLDQSTVLTHNIAVFI